MKNPENLRPFPRFQRKPRAISTIRLLLHFVTACYTFFFLFCISITTRSADWPTLHGNPEHTGYTDEQLHFPLTLQWAVEFEGERIATVAEPRVVAHEVYVTTLSRRTFALDQTSGALRHVSVDSVGARVSPFVSAGLTFLVGVEESLAQTLQQTPAFSEGRYYYVPRDLRLRCVQAGKLIWASEQMFGQSARDYYPVIVRAGGKKFVVVRTNPVLNMAQQIANDRNFLTKQAGIDAGDWKKLDAWIKSPAAAGTPELIASEQVAIVHYLETNQWAQTFFVFDAESGNRAFTPPILWAGGCQGVGTPPAITKENKAVVLYRSAYGNWNHGVAPLVALGLLNFETGRIEPLRHNQGAQPPWNTFWGTADEEQNFTIAGDDLIIVHQGTLARFNLKTHDLEKIWGERDTYGGFKNPSWARNEWHGPGRGGVAISNGRIYWITGSRLLCLGPEKPAKQPAVKTIPGGEQSTGGRSSRGSPQSGTMRSPSHDLLTSKDLNAKVIEVVSKTWAPLYVEPGLAGREFFFADSREIFTALSYAYPHLPKSEQSKLKKYLGALFQSRPPFGTNALASLSDGERREYFQVPPQALTRLGNDKPAHRFGGVYAAKLYADRCKASREIEKAWPQIESAFIDFTNKNPNFGQKPELYFNRYFSSLTAFWGIAETTKHHAFAEQAKAIMTGAMPTLIQWWKDAGATLTNFNGSQQLDPFIQKGDKLSWAVFPHRHKLAIFRDVTPEIANTVRGLAPEAAAKVWATFTNLAPTWYLVGEERQYHFGENFEDTPDFALAAFQAFAFLQNPNASTLLAHVDISFCKADLYQIQKLAIAMEAQR